jgi:UDP-hydrolysing UDP-N-acetyl-D-glucosamine 2-epimerase
MTKNIAFLTGKRGGYEAMLSIFQLMEESDKFTPTWFVCDQHLMDKFGRTADSVLGTDIQYIPPLYPMDDGYTERAASLGYIALHLAPALASRDIDLLVLYGDRGESLAAAVVATQMGILIAHIQGGDCTGTIDDVMRHTISKMAHIHFVSNRDSALRLETMGEINANIWIVGDPKIDALKKFPIVKRKRSGIIVLFHPDTNRPGCALHDISEVLEAITAFEDQKILIYPCSDPEHEVIIEEIESFDRLFSNAEVWKNIPYPEFIQSLAEAKVLVGNSSAGLIEAPYLLTPSVNIGNRQKGRWRDPGVFNASIDKHDIRQAINKAIDGDVFCSEYYGDGTSSAQMLGILSKYNFEDTGLRVKKWR